MRLHGTGSIGGLIAGAAAMYLFDPSQGKRRRAMVRDQMIHAGRVLQDAYDDVAQDFDHRIGGAKSRAGKWGRTERVSDDVLTERVRSRLGRLISHPRAIDVTSGSGRVTLRGPVFRFEVARVLRRVASVPGVREVDNQLEAHDVADVPGLQGGAEDVSEPQLDIAQRHWLPATRFVVGLTGTLLALFGLARPGMIRTTAGLAGLSLLTRALTNLPLDELADAASCGTRP